MKPQPADRVSNLLPPVRRYRFVPETEYEFFEDSDKHPFEPDAEDFRLANAWWLIDAAMLAYSRQNIVSHWCRRAGFERIEWYSNHGTQCYIAVCDEYIFVVFRGTDPPKRLRNFILDWRINFRISLVDFAGLPGCVHRGFREALANVSKEEATGCGADLQQLLRSLAAENPKATFWFTGHSQGGALATLAAAQYAQAGGRAQLYTFGSPRVCDQTFERSFKVPAWRIVNKTDIVTRLPLLGFYSRSAGLFKWPLLGRYRHVGELRYIDSEGNIGPEVLKPRERFRLLTYIPRKVRKLRQRFTNHAPLHYAIYISNALANAEAGTFPVVSAGRVFTNADRLKRWLLWGVASMALGGGLLFGVGWLLGKRPPHITGDVVIIENGLGTDREEFYSTPEGSEMFPLAVAQSLRFSDEEFSDEEMCNDMPSSGFRGTFDAWFGPSKKRLLDNLDCFGFIKVPKTDMNPLGYIGLTVRRREDTGIEMVGVNCAACHVGQIEYKGKAIRIDGAPNMLDMFGFVRKLSSISPFDVNFIVLAKEGSVQAWEMKFSGWRIYLNQMRQVRRLFDISTPPLNGRVDAFGTARAMFFDDYLPLTAPSSYPHLWGFQKTQWYHWNANTNSIMHRNLGQALGTGAGIARETCETTVHFDGIDRLERLGYKIKAPSWPAELGPIDEKARELGERIYLGVGPYASTDRGNCAGCHDAYDTVSSEGTELNDYRLFSLNQVGTDPNEALNFIPSVNVKEDVCNGNQAPARPMDLATAHEFLLGRIRFDSAIDRLSGPEPYPDVGRGKPDWRVRAICDKPDNHDCEVYPAKPLVGIWATAPYLHNGSVPTIWSLLMPAVQRPPRFNVGHRAYDPQKLGYVIKADDTARLLDTSLPGNSNKGHEFGINLTNSEKRALIEYLKSLKEGDQQKLNLAAKRQNGQ